MTFEIMVVSINLMISRLTARMLFWTNIHNLTHFISSLAQSHPISFHTRISYSNLQLETIIFVFPFSSSWCHLFHCCFCSCSLFLLISFLIDSNIIKSDQCRSNCPYFSLLRSKICCSLWGTTHPSTESPCPIHVWSSFVFWFDDMTQRHVVTFHARFRVFQFHL
jgi:hypothetical protein